MFEYARNFVRQVETDLTKLSLEMPYRYFGKASESTISVS